MIDTGADLPPSATVAGPEPSGPLLNRWAVHVVVARLGLAHPPGCLPRDRPGAVKDAARG